ncbi:MAG: O-antigen ligase family protein [Candidatus Curtissbacteria bacterium]|nr:O-antigen ligase family protein [Candidatus Curtissbacteria bacterium]
MTEKASIYLDKILLGVFFALIIITPFLFSTRNTELFEVPKMLFVYLMAALVFTLTLAKFALLGKIVIPKNIVVFVFLAFLIVQFISTATSIDRFTSIFGYPTRLNGGLLSQLSYFVIFTGILININRQQAKKLLVAFVVGAFAVSLWGIPSHFGLDFNCLALNQGLFGNCWQKEFNPTLRIFSTLGQPNWLASYLVLTLPVSMALILSSKKQQLKVFFSIVTIVIFWALLLTNSRAGALGALTATAAFLVLVGPKKIVENLRPLGFIFLIFALLTLAFGSTLTGRITESITKNAPQVAPSEPAAQAPTQTALATGGTESGQIRLIVWRGAVDIIKNYSLLGSGPETFAYSYYFYRPFSHNQTTEWNFFYNKAHNEPLNYFATTGILGGSLYLGLAAAFILTGILTRSKNQVLVKSTTAAITGYLTTILFGFSTVSSQVGMFTLAASALVLLEKNPQKELSFRFLKRNTVKNASLILISVLGLFIISQVLRLYLADISYERARNLQDSRSLTAFSNAIEIFPTINPFMLSDSAYTTALFAISTEDKDTETLLSAQAKLMAEKALSNSPNNLIVNRRVANAYFLLSDVDIESGQKALQVATRQTQLAPTDPQSYLALAKIQAGFEMRSEAKESLNKALSLKGEYPEAKQLLDQL